MIFVDSSFFIGLTDAKDQWHENALKVRVKIHEDMVVSDLVISESVTSIGNRSGGKAGVKLYDFFIDNCQIEYTDENLLRESMEAYIKYDGKLSVADSASIVIMKELGISKIISFDSDFDKVRGIKRVH